jgi:V8-like Glu-specific endopeptidase
VISVALLAVLAVIVATPADGGTTSLAARIGRAVGLLPASTETGRPFGGTPAIGALFTTSNGKLGDHFCTASVVHSSQGDLVVTAAHCMSSEPGTIAFVPGYVNGTTPYGIWTVSRVFEDEAWTSSSSPDDDVAFLRVAQEGTDVPIEDITGAETLGTGLPARQFTQVVGYPNGASQPAVCQNWTKAFGPTQLEFDCGGYPAGTSGGPFLVRVDTSTGQGTVDGVIGGYETGGDSPDVSYSAVFGPRVAALYKQAQAAS